MKCFLDYSNETDWEGDVKVLKCIFLGEPHTGKTSILATLAEEMFLRNREPTIGIDFRSLHAIGISPAEESKRPSPSSGPSLMQENVKHSHYKLQMWDCAGQIRFRSIVKSYYRMAHLVFVVFDLTDYSSFESVEGWVKDIKANIPHPFVMMLLGNKRDLVEQGAEEKGILPCESTEKIEQRAKELGFHGYHAVSAMTGKGLEDSLNAGLSRIHELVMTGVIKIDSSVPGTVRLNGGGREANEITKCFGGCID